MIIVPNDHCEVFLVIWLLRKDIDAIVTTIDVHGMVHCYFTLVLLTMSARDTTERHMWLNVDMIYKVSAILIVLWPSSGCIW